jgi:hypothetical protein
MQSTMADRKELYMIRLDGMTGSSRNRLVEHPSPDDPIRKLTLAVQPSTEFSSSSLMILKALDAQHRPGGIGIQLARRSAER